MSMRTNPLYQKYKDIEPDRRRLSDAIHYVEAYQEMYHIFGDQRRAYIIKRIERLKTPEVIKELKRRMDKVGQPVEILTLLETTASIENPLTIEDISNITHTPSYNINECLSELKRVGHSIETKQVLRKNVLGNGYYLGKTLSLSDRSDILAAIEVSAYSNTHKEDLKEKLLQLFSKMD